MSTRDFVLPYRDEHLSATQRELQLEIYKRFQEGRPVTIRKMNESLDYGESEVGACFARLEIARVIKVTGYSNGQLYRIIGRVQ